MDRGGDTVNEAARQRWRETRARVARENAVRAEEIARTKEYMQSAGLVRWIGGLGKDAADTTSCAECGRLIQACDLCQEYSDRELLVTFHRCVSCLAKQEPPLAKLTYCIQYETWVKGSDGEAEPELEILSDHDTLEEALAELLDCTSVFSPGTRLARLELAEWTWAPLPGPQCPVARPSGSCRVLWKQNWRQEQSVPSLEDLRKAAHSGYSASATRSRDRSGAGG